jgi:predicted negative regulator of RcsB-dependent stress response
MIAERVAVVLLASLVAGCATREAEPDGEERTDQAGETGESGETQRRVTELVDPNKALTEELLLGLALAKNHHHKADIYLKEGRIDDAVVEVQKVFEVRFPAGSPEGEDVVLDARARLAKLLVTKGAIDQAMEVVDTGIAGTRRQSFFVANLHAVRGEVWEARAVSIEEEDPGAAKAARHEAIRAFDTAIRIENALLDMVTRERTQP